MGVVENSQLCVVMVCTPSDPQCTVADGGSCCEFVGNLDFEKPMEIALWVGLISSHHSSISPSECFQGKIVAVKKKIWLM